MSPSARSILVIGAGMSGILAAIELRRAGFTRVRVLEKAATLGGTWRDNVYPGLTCDIPSHVYSYSFAPNPDFSHRYAPGPEILAYLERTAREHGVDALIEPGRDVTSAAWDGQHWRVTDSRGREETADCVIAATGVLHHPHVPALPGAERFAGAMFHSAQWDDGVAIDGKRVGIVGTGSTAVQLVQALGARAGSLTVFQRSAQWVFPSRNKPYSAEDRERFRADPGSLSALRDELERAFVAGVSDAMIDEAGPGMAAIERACLAHLEERVRDPGLRERLRPDYRAACKRLVMGDTFYDTMQLGHVHLETDGIERIEPRGIVTADGALHELDVIVLATGYRAHDFVRPMRVTGSGGRSLDDAWRESPHAYQTVSVPGFPNFFFVVGPHSPIANLSVISIAELQVGYILKLLGRMEDERLRALSASERATARYCETLRQGLRGTIWATGCSSWFQDDSGQPALWPFSVSRFAEELRAPRHEDFDVSA